MRRAFLTAHHGLKTHHNRENFEFKLLKFFRETIKSQCDLGFYTEDLLKFEPKLDISEFTSNKIWFLKDAYIDVEGIDHREKMIEIYEKEGTIDSLVNYMKEICPKRPENSQQAFLRVKKAKEDLRQYLREIEEKSGNEIQDFQVILVAHSNVLRHFTATSVSDKFKPVGDHYFQNAEILEYEFEY